MVLFHLCLQIRVSQLNLLIVSLYFALLKRRMFPCWQHSALARCCTTQGCGFAEICWTFASFYLIKLCLIESSGESVNFQTRLSGKINSTLKHSIAKNRYCFSAVKTKVSRSALLKGKASAAFIYRVNHNLEAWVKGSGHFAQFRNVFHLFFIEGSYLKEKEGRARKKKADTHTQCNVTIHMKY